MVGSGKHPIRAEPILRSEESVHSLHVSTIKTALICSSPIQADREGSFSR